MITGNKGANKLVIICCFSVPTLSSSSEILIAMLSILKDRLQVKEKE